MSRILRSGEIIQEGDEWQSSVAPQNWFPVCGQQIGQSLWECNVGHYRRPTKLAPDAGDSAASSELVQASALSTSQTLSTPQRG